MPLPMNRRELLAGAVAVAAAPLLPKELAASPIRVEAGEIAVDLAARADLTAYSVLEMQADHTARMIAILRQHNPLMDMLMDKAFDGGIDRSRSTFWRTNR